MTREELDEHNRIEDARKRDRPPMPSELATMRARIEVLRAAYEERSKVTRARDFPALASYPLTIEVMWGPKYARLVRNEGQRSVIGFVELATGAIYYPKGWAGPQKNHARGNVFADDYGLSAFGRYGVKTLR